MRPNVFIFWIKKEFLTVGSKFGLQGLSFYSPILLFSLIYFVFLLVFLLFCLSFCLEVKLAHICKAWLGFYVPD